MVYQYVIITFKKEGENVAYIVQDLTGKEYALEAEIELTEEENGMVTIDLEINPTENNQKFIRDINEHWTISGIKTAQYGKFYIQHLDKVGVGDWPQLKITAVAEFIHKLQTTTFDGYYTGSRTAAAFFNELSLQSGITFQPIDFKPAFGWEKFGLGVHNISEFNRGLNNYGYTYYPVTSQLIELRNQIGRDTNFMIKNAMNSDSMEMEIDRTEVYTYVEGYADYTEEDGEDFYEAAKLYSFYKHPVLYDVLGELKAETYKNQKINSKETLDEYLKSIVDNSIKFTITTDFHKIEDYPFAVPMLGDRIRVQDDAIDVDTTARVIKIKTSYDIYGDVINYELDFGNFPVSERVKSQLSSVQRQLEDLISGRNPVNNGMLDAYISAVIENIKQSETEVKFGGHLGYNGLFLVDPNDPNNVVGLFSGGIIASDNGFAGGLESNAALTYQGLVAERVFGKLIAGEQLLIANEQGTFMVNGGEVEISGGSLSIIGGLDDANIKNASKWNNQGTYIDNTGVYTGRLNAEQIQVGKVGDEFIGSADDWNNQGTYIDDTGVYTGSLTANQINAGTLFLERFLGITGKNGKLKITDEYIRVEDAADATKYLEMNINTGFTISKLPYTQIAPDGRIIYQDGYMRGGAVANIIHFNANKTVNFNGMNWIYANASAIRTYYINDQYKGRFLDVITAIGLTADSPSGSARVDIEVVTFSGQVVAATNVFTAITEGDMDGHRIRCDLQALYGVVPDHRQIGLYVRTKTTVNTAAEVAFRVNRGEWND